MKKAFTLLEVLVVLGIIAVLIGLGSVSFTLAQKKARDVRRKEDLTAMQKFLEQCYSVNNYSYPTGVGQLELSNGNKTLTATCPTTPSTQLAITDQTTKTYSLSSTTSSYTISITLEDSTPYYVSNQQ